MVKIGVLHRKLSRDLGRMKGQLLTLSLIAGSGIALFVSSWSCYQSLIGAKETFYESHRFADVFVQLKRAPADLLNEWSRGPFIRQVETRLVVPGVIELSHQDEPISAHLVSFPRQPETSLNRVQILEGHEPRAREDILVHPAFAKAHRLKIGQEFEILIQGQKRKFRMSGVGTSPEFVYALNPATPLPDDRYFGVFWLKFETLEFLIDFSGAFNSVLVRLESGASVETVKAELNQRLKPFGAMRAIGRDHQLSARLIEDEISQLRITAVFMPFIFLGISAFLINVILSRYLALQRSQIGGLKALGFRDREIAIHYLQFISVIVSIGAVPGLLVGYLLGGAQMDLYRQYFNFPVIIYEPSAGVFLAGLGLATFMGLVGGGWAVRKAISVQPAEAMRAPAPEIFKTRGLGGTGRWIQVDQRTRMALRHLFHRPLRVTMTVTGVATGLSLMVMAMAWSDIINHMVTGQFGYAQREDMSLGFVQPRPLSVIGELNRMPGVLKVEGSREVPVYLSFGPHGQNTVLQGLQGTKALRRVTDADFRPLDPPQTGLLLSRRFSEKWQLRPGDVVRLERLDGVRGIFDLPVEGFVDDMLGESAYLGLDSLWRLLGEEPVYSTAHLLVDPNESSRIYRLLHERPQVGTISLKTVMLRGFMESIGGMILAVVGLLVAFAVMVSVGVVYNSVRISLAERSWEFAGLRVLGYKPREVFDVLLIEFGFCLIAAIPLGLWGGRALIEATLGLVDSESFNFPAVIQPSSYGVAVGILVLSFSFSLTLAYFAVRQLKLVEALKARE